MEFSRGIKRVSAVAALTAGALGVGTVVGAEVVGTAKPDTDEVHHTRNARFKVEDWYTPDGKRLTYYQDVGRDINPNATASYCDGNDLVDVTRTRDDEEIYGAFKSRSVDHPACDDGRLTPSDFPANPSEPR